MISFKVFKFNYKKIIIVFILLLAHIFPLIFVHNFVFAKNDEAIPVPIIMYHSILKSRSGNYIVHPDTFENDLEYIQNKGYTTITMADLINYVYEDSPLPEKPIIITFDDGFYNNFGYAVPLLHKYDMKAVVSIVGKYSDTYSKSDEANLNYGYLRWKDINDLMQDGCIEFQNHTYDLHSTSKRQGSKKLPYESVSTYTDIFTNDILKLQDEFEKNCNGYKPNTFTYPLGAVSKDSIPLIKDLGFKASLSCTSGINYITKNPECLYLLKRNNRSGSVSTQSFFRKILK